MFSLTSSPSPQGEGGWEDEGRLSLIELTLKQEAIACPTLRIDKP
jgi:hypothetical protein